MFRILLFFSTIVFLFGWMAGMAVYKVVQILFMVVSVIIMLMMGSIVMGLLNKNN